ncbi:SUMF1/EgtB/PvdO family nonheme iron enzyme [Nitrogeniibacter mangrovi]|uniref:SUMF1/EgtB/PvdO family nonheme iron enzyme n=1 Tax=Nitrogeniibacter mangrovi TaxID=2016596 RepID=A0A6C1B3L3_9RHOO|nr:SUMF1/EgtB/PvdO family nonheme iron enzyme [Nitrogeniibacter mangrovi]QID17438.1 SUMF1/EgtB/PvdO family nonheme iron enzyme [Nitrogeniibacter mangrovi]
MRKPGSGNVFINYRRDDSAGWAGRLHDRLARVLPSRRVFIDVEGIEGGEAFARLLDAQVARCDVFLALIGSHWLDLADADGRRRIDDPNDFVRIEIASALRRDGVYVIPVLVDEAPVPNAEALPEDLRPLVEHNAVEISRENFDRDADRLIATIRRRLPFTVRHHRLVRALWATSVLCLVGAATVAAIYFGRVPTAFGLENLVRPSAREWRTLTYVDKTNPALLRAFIGRHPGTPEGDEAGMWMHYISARAWSKIQDTSDRRPISDFLSRFGDSAEADAAKRRLAELPPPREHGPGEAAPLSRFADCPDCPEMVAIPTGHLLMGSLDTEWTAPEDRYEGPRQAVTIARPFAVGRFEVTVGQFRQFVEATGRQMGFECIGIITPGAPAKVWDAIPGRDFRHPGFAQTDAHPVVCVNWDDAVAYTQWLSKQTGATYRLPTEAEWEYVARAGSQDSYTYGDDESRLCQYGNGADRGMDDTWNANRWCADGTAIGTARVGSYRPNAFGLMDTHGNVHEWVADCYHEGYAGMPEATRASGAAWITPNCATRVIRGGCWAYPPTQLRSARREAWEPYKRSYCVGFRVARELGP